MTALPGWPDVEGPAYPVRRWVFDDALDRWDIDLGDSHLEARRAGELPRHDELVLDYGVDRGGTRLRERIAGLYGGSVESVLVTHGAQEALFLLLSTLLGPGDTVVTVQPGWRQSVDVPRLLGCRVVTVPPGRDRAVDVDRVTAAVGGDARVISLSSPSNPTGGRADPADLRALARVAARVGGWLVLDEEYSTALSTSLAVDPDPEVSGRVVSVSGLSKVFGLPGLRTGWMYGPPQVVTTCAERKHLTTVANSVLTEALAADALGRYEHYLADYRRLCDAGLRQLEDWVARRDGRVRLEPPDGTPFGWLWLDTGEPALAYCRRVLETRVLLMPGETFGARGGFRVTFARDPAALAEGLRRAGDVLDEWPPPPG